MTKRVLVAGGYGAVGAHICRRLITDTRVGLVIAGRNKDRAASLAQELKCEHRELDITNAAAIGAALSGIDIVINAAVDVKGPTTQLAQAAAALGRIYLDMAAVPVQHLKDVVALHEKATGTGALLVTGLGVNPGIAGIWAMSNRTGLDRTESVELRFTLGSKLGALSTMSIQGVGDMIALPPLEWREGRWQKPAQSGGSRKAGAPYHKKILYGPALITEDLVGIPAALNLDRFTFLSGVEETLQSLVFIAGIKLGQTRTETRAARFLRLLRRVSSKHAKDDSCLEMTALGSKSGKRVQRRLSLYCPEEVATAVAPVIVVRQILDGEITQKGAYYGCTVAAPTSFNSHLATADVHFQETIEDAAAAN